MKNKYYTTRIRSIKKENEKTKTFVLDISLPSKPGQYVMVWLPRENEKPFGVVTPDPLTLTISNVGHFTEKLHNLKNGDALTFRGPYGSSFKTKKEKKLLLVGGGFGIVPLYFLATEARKNKKIQVSVAIGAKTKEELLFLDRFKALGCKTYAATDDGSYGFKGFASSLVSEMFEKNLFEKVYTCGPREMMRQVVLICDKKKVPSEVSMESFFKCGGIGLCGECSIKGFLICKDGPVFNGNILIP